jgi:hypothetical protein
LREVPLAANANGREAQYLDEDLRKDDAWTQRMVTQSRSPWLVGPKHLP